MKYLNVSFSFMILSLASLVLTQQLCDFSSDCPPKLQCVARECIDPCPGKCGSNGICNIDDKHEPYCTYPSMRCGFDKDCSEELKCTAGVCIDPCIGKCAADEECTVDMYREAQCTYVPANCSTHDDCKLHLKCDRRTKKCVDPCIGYCNSREPICLVVNHVPNCYQLSIS